MCDPGAGDEGAAPARSPSRRRFLLAASLGMALPLFPALAGTAVAAPQPSERLGGLPIHPRADWAAGRAATGRLKQEAPGDVRFLLVHHSVSPNDYSRADVPGLIRGFYAAHTGPKGWPDVAYNFFVDRFGGIWEGRTGSLGGPVIADATGGNQGFSQLCCLIGDHRTQSPTDKAVTALADVLAALADVYRIDTSPDATATFISRGSNRWAAGRSVTTSTLAGHRDMSQTECPGDAAYSLIAGVLTEQVNARRSSSEEPASPSTTVPAPTKSAPVPSPASSTALPASTAPDPAFPAGTAVLAAGGATVLAAAAAGLVVARRRRMTDTVAVAAPAGAPPAGLGRWEVVAGDTGKNADAQVPAVAAMVERGGGGVIGAVATTGGAGAVIEACRARARQLLDGSTTESDAAQIAADLAACAMGPDVLPSGSDLDLAVVVVLPATCALVATDGVLGVILTTEDAAYRPREGRSHLVAEGRRTLAKASSATDDVAAILLSTPVPRSSGGGFGPSPLPALARAAITWPSVKLGVQNHVQAQLRECGSPGALVALIHRSAITRHHSTSSPSRMATDQRRAEGLSTHDA